MRGAFGLLLQPVAAFRQQIEEGAGTRRHPLRRRVHRIQRQRCQRIFRQQGFELTASNEIDCLPVRQDGDAEMMQDRILHGVGVVNLDAASDRHDVPAMLGFEGPLVGRAEARIDDALVAAQIVRSSWQRPPAQIGRRCHQIQANRPQPPGDQRARLQSPDPECEFDAFLDEVHEALGKLDVHAHVGIILQIFRQDRRQIVPAERGRDTEPQRAGWPRRRLAHAGARQVVTCEHVAGDLIDAQCLGGWPELAGRAQKELRAELAFEHGDALADRRLADAELPRSRREAAALHGAHEGAKTVETIHCLFHFGIIHIRLNGFDIEGLGKPQCIQC